MKRIFTLLLSLTVCMVLIISFTSCSKNEGTSDFNTNKSTDSLPVTTEGNVKKSQKTLEKFLKAWTDLKLKDTLTYIEDAPKDSIAFEDADDFLSRLEAMAKSTAPEFENDLMMVFKSMLDQIKSKSTYKSEFVSETTNRYIYKVEITAVDFEKLNKKLESINTDEIANTVFDKITKDDREDEALVIENYLNAISAAYEDAIIKAGTKTETVDIFIIEKDGKWVISKDSETEYFVEFGNKLTSIFY